MPLTETFRRLAADLRAVDRADGRRTRLVAVDGYGGAGKSTFAANLVAAADDATIVHLDDLVRGWEGGVDVERVRADVLAPRCEDRAARYLWQVWMAEEDDYVAADEPQARADLVIDGAPSTPPPDGRFRVLVDRRRGPGADLRLQ